MHSERSYRIFVILLLLVLSILDICSFCPVANADSSAGRTLTWSVVKTPTEGPDNVIRSGSEINSMALGNGVIYCVDTENLTLFRSLNGGYSFTDISNSLTAAASGTALRGWSVALAPDDARFVAVVTTALSPPNPLKPGPQQVYVSIDGGNNWQNTGLPLSGPNSIVATEYISCIDISRQYGNGFRDISIGTRIETTNSGQVLNLKYGTVGGWLSQGIPPAAVTSLKFSPNYLADSTLAVISCGAAAVLNLEVLDLQHNLPVSWGVLATFATVPVANVIGTDLALPSDFNGQNPGLQGCFTSIQTDSPFNDPMSRSTQTGVFYINPLIAALPYTITPLPVVSSTSGRRIYSIAYNGSEINGILLAGEASADPNTAMVRIYQSSNPQSSNLGGATWTSSLDYNSYKSPTGGGNTNSPSTPKIYYANAILVWGYNGVAYCGTSSEDDYTGGTGWNLGQWPKSKLNSVPLDESAFSYSYNSGLGWNQIGLIDTEISQLSDSAALEPPPAATQSSVLYLSSINGAPTSFDSVWRSTSDTLGEQWERILIHTTSNVGTILRVNVKEPTSTALIFGYLTTPTIMYTADEGQKWELILAGISSLRDITFRDESTIYVLEDYRIRQLTMGDTNWVPGEFVNTDLLIPAHTICIPQVSPIDTDIVLVGTGISTAGNSEAYVAWTDFSQPSPKFNILRMLPQSGNVHVIADSKYDQNNIIYAAVNVDIPPSSDGVIYRWTIGKSTDWDELEPVNRAFFGIAMAGDVLYGAWNFDTTTLLNSGGVDRTLDPRIDVPPAPEWDELKDGLPVSTDTTNFPVLFTHEPTSLKISSSTNNTLWAIDNLDKTAKVYDFDNKIGCLWQYIDSVARVSPWPIAPASGSFIGADPVTGRSQQIDIKWRPLQDIFGYDILMAKDVNFTLLLTQNINMFPVDNKTGAWVVTLDQSQQLSPGVWIPPGVLEAGKSYYWEVRGSRTITGAAIHSLWSPVMFFSVKPGFAVRGIGNGPQLLTPIDGMCQDCQPTIGFSWTPVKNAKKYEFTLANDQDLKNILVQTVTTTTAYKYEGKLEPGRIYFWRVKAVAPFESDPSPTGTFVIAGSRPLLSWPSLPPSYLWIVVIIAAAVLVVLIVALFIYNYMRRY